MAENVDIGNVGGDGVASEVTLARLTATMELMAKKKGVNPADITKKMQQVMDASSKTIKENSQAKKQNTDEVKTSTSGFKKLNNSLLGIAGGIVGSLGSSLSGFAGSLMKGSDQLADYASHIPLFGGALGGLASIIDTNVSVFRELSNVGAIFGDGLNDIRRLSANAGIPLGEFTQLVSSNSERMKYFGGTVAQGATAFAAMSKTLRTGPGYQFMMLGYTATELNESLLDYSEFNARQMISERQQNRLSAAGAADYLQTIESLATVTGKRRDQIRDELNENLSDQRVRAAIAGMTTDQSNAFNASLTQAALAGPALREAIIDMADGFANDPFTAQLAANSKTFREQAHNLENMTALQRNNFFRSVAEEADAYAMGLGDALQGVIREGGVAGDMAALGASMSGKYEELTQSQIDAQNAANALELQRSEGLKTFHDTIRQITTGLQTILTNQKMGDDGKPIAGSSILERMTAGFSAVAKTLGDFIASPAFTTGIESITQNIQAFIDNFSKFGLGTALFGKEAEIDESGQKIEGTAVKGLMGDMFGEGGTFDGILQSAMEGIKDGISKAVVKFGANLFDFNLSWDEILVGGIAGLGLLIAAPVIGIPGALAAAVIAVIGYDKLVEGLGVAWDAITGVWTGITTWWDNLDFMTPISETWDAITGVWTGITDWWATVDLMTPISETWDSITGVWTGITDWWDNLDFMAPISEAWDSITGVWTGITDWWDTVDLMTPLTNMWAKVTGFFDFGEEGFSISALFGKAWDVVTGYFSFAGKVWIGIGGLFDAAWTKVTGWLGFGDKTWSLSDVFKTAWDTVTGFFSMDTLYSIGALADAAWTKVTGWFGFSEGESLFSISQLAKDAWATVTGFFSFGEGEAAYSISGIASGAWETVKGWFSFDNFEFPSITGLFDNVWEKLTGFFDFDFELPSFKSFLPAWMGGGDDTDNTDNTSDITVDASPAADGANALMNAQTAMANFANIEGLENNLNAIKNGLDIDGVTSYTEAMRQLVEVLGELNDELNKDNYTGPGHGTNAGTVVDKMQTIGSGGGGSNDQLNNTMQQVLSVLNQIKNGTELTASNTRNIVGSNLARSGVSNIAR